MNDTEVIMVRPLLIFLVLQLLLSSCSGIKKSENSYKGHGEESVSAYDLERFKPPTLETELSSKIQSMMDITRTSLGVISNNGKQLYVNWRVTGTNQVWKIPGAMRFPKQLTGGEESTYISSISVDGKWLFLSRDSKGDEYTGIYRQSTNGGPLEPIIRKKKVKASLQWVSSDNKSIYYRANDIDPKSFALYKYDLLTKKSKLLLDRPGYWFLEEVSEDGLILVGRNITNTGVEYFSLDRARTRIQYGINENGYYKAHAMNARTLKKIKTPKFKNAIHIYFGFTSRNGRYTTLGVVTSKSPRTNFIYDWKTGTYEQWTTANHPEINTSDFRAENIEYYESHDKVQIPMLVSRPKKCQIEVCPVIVWFHGGPESQSFPGFSPTRQL